MEAAREDLWRGGGLCLDKHEPPEARMTEGFRMSQRFGFWPTAMSPVVTQSEPDFYYT